MTRKLHNFERALADEIVTACKESGLSFTGIENALSAAANDLEDEAIRAAVASDEIGDHLFNLRKEGM